MASVFKIASRNVFAHKVKTLIVGLLIFLGIFLVVVGNSFLDSIEEGIRKSYSDTISGDIAVLKAIDFDYSLFGTWNNVGNLQVPMIPDIEDTREYLESHPAVASVTTASSNFLIINTGEGVSDFWINAIAIDPQSYKDFFDWQDTIVIHEGRFLEPMEEGIVLSKWVADYMLDYKGIELNAGDKLLLNGYSANGFRIREIPIVGIMELRYIKGEMYDMVPRTCYVDQQTMNLLSGVTVDSENDEDNPLIEEFRFDQDWDELFNDTVSMGSENDVIETDLDVLLGDMSLRHNLSQVNPEDWQWMLVNLKDRSPKVIGEFRKDLEAHFEERFSHFIEEDFSRPLQIAGELVESQNPSQMHLRSLLSQEQFNALEQAYLFSDAHGANRILLEIFNSWLDKKDLYDAAHFQDEYFSSITENLLKKDQRGYQLVRRNRLLLEELYPYSMNPGPDYTVSEWWHASAPMSSTTMGIQWVMNTALVILFIVTIIIIMNTLVISVMERTGEIGTIRAMGGQKGFITKLFITETLMISFLFGSLGFIAGWGFLSMTGMNGIPAPEGSALQFIAGTEQIFPTLSKWTIGFSLIFMLFIGLLSSLYPLRLALKIEPVEAMREE